MDQASDLSRTLPRPKKFDAQAVDAGRARLLENMFGIAIASEDPMPELDGYEIARLRLAELALRSRDPSDADALLRACAAHVAQLGEEQLTYALLRAIANLRLTPAQSVDRESLDRARERHANVDQRVPAWLEQLDVSDTERQALGY